MPIDATLLMEAGQEHAQTLAAGLALSEVEENVREWGEAPQGRRGRGTADLGAGQVRGIFQRQRRATEQGGCIFDKVREHYADVVDAYLREGPSRAEVLYAPVDTIGPIELMDVRWEKSEGRNDRMLPVYRVRVDSQGRTARRSVKGAEPVLAYLIRDILLTVDEMLKQDLVDVEQGISDVDLRTERARSNWWKRSTRRSEREISAQRSGSG